jgi:biopolymer transport protein ExbD
MNRMLLSLVALLPMQQAPKEPTAAPAGAEPTAAAPATARTRDERVLVASVVHRVKKSGPACTTYDGGEVCRDASHWVVGIASNIFVLEMVDDELSRYAQFDLEPGDVKAGEVRRSKVRVQLRADRIAPYGVVQQVIEKCHRAGLHAIEFGVGGAETDGFRELRITLFWNAKARATVRRVGTRTVEGDAETKQALEAARAMALRNGLDALPVTIDAVAEVPWSDVVKLLDLCREAKLDPVEFATAEGK